MGKGEDVVGGPVMSIGAVARATGIPANTLRTWERRYGYPCPERTEGGQRLYAATIVGQLRTVARALQLGHRPRDVVGLDADALDALLGRADAPPVASADPSVAWFDAVDRLDATALDLFVEQAYARTGAVPFLDTVLGPFLREVGERWAGGALCVYQEHFASERVKAFLVRARGQLTARGTAVVCASLPGERHVLGLHMAALALAAAGRSVVFLGADTPVDEVAAAASGARADAVVVSMADGSDPAGLSALRDAIPAAVDLIAGGTGVVDVDGVLRLHTFAALFSWAGG